MKLYSGKIVNRKRTSSDDVIQTAEPISRGWHLKDAARIETEGDESGDQGQKELLVLKIEWDVDENV